INGETITPVVNSTHWSSDETILLIRAWGEHRDEFAEIKRNHSVWNKVVEKLLSRGFFRTVDQCRNRWKFLESKFKVAKKEIVRSSAKPAWEFFNEMLAAKVYHCHGTNHQQHSPTANINTSSLPSGDSKTAYSEHPKRPRSSDPDEVAYDGWPLKSPRVYHHRHHRQLAQSPSADMDIESVLRHYFDDEKSMPLSKPQLLAFLTNMSQLREKREARRTEEHREYQRIRVLEEQRYHEFQMQVMSMVSRHLAPGILDKPGDNGDQHCEPAVNNEVSNARSSQCNGVDGGSEDGDKSQGVRSRSYSHNDGSRNYQAWPGLELSPPAMLATRNTLKMVHVRQKQQKQSPSTRKHKKTKSEGKDRQ
ncbi:hypothetical protein EV182_003052, partial [Spiromyces aspiralis]